MAGDLFAIALGSAGALIWLLLLLSKLTAREFRGRGYGAMIERFSSSQALNAGPGPPPDRGQQLSTGSACSPVS